MLSDLRTNPSQNLVIAEYLHNQQVSFVAGELFTYKYAYTINMTLATTKNSLSTLKNANNAIKCYTFQF